ncbi:TylF/MycF/NovP-related O-methyltransferase [Desulfobacter postgatei]|jgi:hypothetical protein|uniref:TylF/MycF/NovP-related O-methyltransferase n=1 Tax=Desulfobacter postgatei TaxID=2293 RepID=UPI002A37016C|nr:TylF/MycF/NovP-related O-methyltransferase [Desulfobacter postgatei]MDX9964149.1 TylF/MycF/NovP-related O-methyltransferase [Desulfobacter postgatei]
MKQKPIKVLTNSSQKEIDERRSFFELFKVSPLPESELLQNLGLYINRQTLSRIIFMHELYKRILHVHGVIIEFGVRWGQNLALFESFRGMYEPYNYNRKIIGFDTFSGFPEITDQDGKVAQVGDYSVQDNYEEYLKKVLLYHESENPISHKKKISIVKGDAVETFGDYLKNHPETIVAFAYFDFDLYKPTKECLRLLLPRITKGSIIAFDELNCPEFPGETLAVMEVLGLTNYAIRRNPLNPLISYIVIN